MVPRVFFLIFALFLFSTDLTAKSTGPRRELTINIHSRMNKGGLERDALIFQDAIQKLGYKYRVYDIGDPPQNIKHANINVFFERLRPGLFFKGKRNWFVPNPEWCGYEAEMLDRLTLILCRTREVERIFSELGYPTYYIGFTSIDRYDPSVNKNPKQLLHTAGGSSQKGTPAIIKVWERRPDFPFLKIFRRRGGDVVSFDNLIVSKEFLSEEELIRLQNESGIHLCPSETEGFGHYLMEAMSTKAVVITTNAPPMNEFITDPDLLVTYARTAPQRMGINYYVDDEDLERKIEYALNLPEEELSVIGERNREAYLERSRAFMAALEALLLIDP